jgi:Tol biopolymer transport system component
VRLHTLEVKLRDPILITLVLWCLVVAPWSSGAPQSGSKLEVRFLTADVGAIDYWPCFSPDGKTVLFSRTMDGRKTWDLLVIPTAGGEPRRLSDSGLPVSATRPNWSTRENLIAFTGTSPEGKSTVWLVNPRGTGARQLALTGLSDRVLYPSWYPDGNALAVMDAGDQVIKRIDRARLTAVSITAHSQVLTGMPAVSPDGRWVAFAGQANTGQEYDQGNNSIWLVDNTGIARPVEAVPRQGRTPAWSPDGQSLAFESNRDSSSSELYAVFIINRDGTRLRQITPYEINANHPVFSPDGKRLVFSALHTKGSDATGIAVVDISKQ